MYKILTKKHKGAAVVEMLLILVIMISITLIFKEQMIDLVMDIFDSIIESAGEI